MILHAALTTVIGVSQSRVSSKGSHWLWYARIISRAMSRVPSLSALVTLNSGHARRRDRGKDRLASTGITVAVSSVPMIPMLLVLAGKINEPLKTSQKQWIYRCIYFSDTYYRTKLPWLHFYTYRFQPVLSEVTVSTWGLHSSLRA